MRYSKHAVLVWTLSFLLLSYQIAAQYARPPPPKGNNSTKPKYSLKMALAMVVLVVVFFFLGFISLYARQYAQTRIQGRLDLAHRNGMEPGLDPAVIETFPAFLYSDVKEYKLGRDSLECAVCLNEFQDHEALRLIPKCDHGFHPECIDTWLLSHSTCPVCRANLVPKPGEEPYTWVDPSNTDIESNPPDPGSCTVEEPPPHMPPRQVSIRVDQDQIKEEESPAPPMIINLVNGSEGTNKRGPPRSKSTGMRFAGILFPRSHSTGHSPVQMSENVEKFTLRVPEEVRAQLMNSALIRSRSTNMAFPRTRSTRKGFRGESKSGKSHGLYERFDPSSQSNRSSPWAFSMTPPFVSRNGSIRNQMGDNEMAAQSTTIPSELDNSSLDHIGGNNERSTNVVRQKEHV